MSTIEDLERKVRSLEDQLKDAKQKLRRARLEAAPVKHGDIVRATRRWKGKLFRVCGVDVRPRTKPWVDGNPQRKDGTYGTAVRHLYDGWELVE